MPPSPLVAYHDNAINAYSALVTSAQSSLSAAQAARAQAEADAAAATTAIAAALDQRKEVQAQLALVTEPAQAAPLLEQLEAILAALRHQQAALLAATTAVVTQSGKIARAEAQLRRGNAGVAAETAARADALVRSEAEQAWKNTLSSSEYTSAVAQATAQFNAVPKTTPNHAAAKARVEGDIPSGLLTLARARAADVLADAAAKKALVTAALATIDSKLGEDGGGFAGHVAQLTAIFEASRDLLRDRATQRLANIDRANRLLAGVVASQALTQAESDAIAAVTAAVAAKQTEIDDAIAASEPQNVIDALQAELEALHDDWELAVPDRIWSNLDAFDEAERILTEVTTADVTPVTTAFDTAETNLALKLTAQLQNTLERASAAESLLELVPAAERAAAPELVFSALRGDE